jgi:ABC-type dipeptide/oligopeptide/nickel transport system permease component
LLLNSAFSFADFFSYLKTLFEKKTFGLSDFDYPQTVQYFILTAFPYSFFNFLLVLAGLLCSLGLFLFVFSVKKEEAKNYSALSHFLRMDKRKVLKQARLAALPAQALLWSIFAPIILILVLIFEDQGLGYTIKAAFAKGDFPLFYGSIFCAFAFLLAVSLFFLMFKIILPRK